MGASVGLDPTADKLHEMMRRAYSRRRRIWAWKINRPYSRDIDKPEPGVLDLADDEVG